MRQNHQGSAHDVGETDWASSRSSSSPQVTRRGLSTGECFAKRKVAKANKQAFDRPLASERWKRSEAMVEAYH